MPKMHGFFVVDTTESKLCVLSIRFNTKYAINAMYINPFLRPIHCRISRERTSETLTLI